MAFQIPVTDIDKTTRAFLLENAIVEIPGTAYSPDAQTISCVHVRRACWHIPLGLWRDLCEEFPNGWDFPATRVEFTKALLTAGSDERRRDQDVVAAEITGKLDSDHFAYVVLPTGFGKTALGTYVAAHYKLRTLVVCFFDSVRRQWVSEFEKFTTARAVVVKQNRIDDAADVCIVGVHKFLNLYKADPSAFDAFGLVIVDEAHIAVASTFTDVLPRLTPRYLVALSATPDRQDGLNRLYRPFFGPVSTFITRFETKPFTVFKVETGVIPEVRFTIVAGKRRLDWTTLIGSLAHSDRRHRIIAQLVLDHLRQHPDAKILVLSGRVTQSVMVIRMIEELGFPRVKASDIEQYWGTKKLEDVNFDAKILVAGTKKAGVGFNDPTRTTLVLLDDCKDPRQFEGRIRTINNTVYDLVDKHPTLERHWKTSRAKWYRRRGAEIATLRISDDE